MNTILLFAAQQIAAFGINKGLDKIFSNREDFSQRLYKIIHKTIDEYQKSFSIPDEAGNFAFYKSQILIEELLKFRLFSISGYSLDVNKIQNALERNPKIIKPTHQELEYFFQTFDKLVKEDEKFRKLEIEAFHKDAIFEIYDKVESILNFLEIHLIEIVPLLEEEYKEEINNCFDEIRELKLNTALKHLTSIEERVNKNAEHVSKKQQASLKFFKGICCESLGLSNEAYEHFINAFKLVPENTKYREKACISYYFLDNTKYKELKETIEAYDDFNAICWAIETIESDNFIEYVINKVDKSVLKKHYYQRLVFNNNLKKNLVNSLKLIEALDASNLATNLPESINYDNLHHWVYVLNTLSIQFFTSTEIPFWGFIKKDEKAIQILELSKLLTEAIKNSELDSSYNAIVFNYYWLQSEINLQSDTITNLKAAYKSLKDKDSFRIMLLANSVQKHESIQAAIKLIDEYEGEIDENLVSLKTFCQLDNPQSEESALEYFKYVKHIDNLNAQNICSYLIPIIKSNIIGKEKLIGLLNEVEYSIPDYHDLVLLLTETLFLREEPLDIVKINNLKNAFHKEEKLQFFISLLYFENQYFEECIEFQKGYVDENKESRDLFLYIRTLNARQRGNQLELLRLLRKWRQSFTFNDFLLRIEIEIQQILKNWDEIKTITEYGLTVLPKDEAFFTLYITALAITGNPHKINEQIRKLKSFSFKYTENALRVASVLVQENYLDEGLELLYQKAVNKQDSLARLNYFSLTTNFPQEYFKELDVIVDDCFVKYEIDGEVQTIHICQNTPSSQIVQQSIGKKVLDTFNVANPLTRKFKNVKVLRIMNKYLALIDDIMTEANSSFSNLPVESIKFESTDKDGLEKTFIENFGADEEERRKHTEKNFKDYRNYQLSFFELVNVNFDGSYVDAYYNLTSSQSDGYIVKPIAFQNKSITFDNKELVIDFSSGLLFFELSERLKLKFNKFIVSGNIYPLIDNLIYKTEAQRNSKMSLSIYNNRIIPHFYSEDFHDKRIEFLMNIKKWFRENSDSIIPEEKIELIRPLYADGKMTGVLEYMVDNAFLSQRENHVLLTDDMGYEKMLRIINWAGTEKYLLYLFPEKKNEILEVMLSFRYIGININADLLYSSYMNHHKEGYNHIYNYALRNLSLSANFNSFNIFYAVDFLRKLAMSPLITKENYKYDATNLFVMLISSFPKPEFSFTLKNRIQQKFNLLGEYLDLTLEALWDALRINSHK